MKIRRMIFLILIIINCITIFCFSHQVGDNSTNQSSTIVEIISNVVPFIKNMQEPDKTIFKEQILSIIVRKTAHFSVYALLGILTMNLMITTDRKFIKNMIISLSFCCIYATTDEFHQLFIQGRSGEIRDVLIDTLGAFTGILLVVVITKIYRKIRSKQGENA